MNLWWRIRRAMMGEKSTNRRFSDRYSLVDEATVARGQEQQGQPYRVRRERVISVPAIILLSFVLCSLLFSITVMNTIGKDATVVIVIEDDSEQTIKEQKAGFNLSITKFKEVSGDSSGQGEDEMKHDVLGNELGGLPITAP